MEYSLPLMPREGDAQALTRLWSSVFGDGDEIISGFFRLLYAPELCRCVMHDGEVASAGYCLTGPVTPFGLRCAYIYAVATSPEHRGRGLGAAVCRALTENAFLSGADIVATLPAEESLFSWYGSVLGMTPAFRKGGGGVVFPPPWHEYSRICGEPSPHSPGRLMAVGRPGLVLPELSETGWDICFD